jgi:osmotically-inducible protein OsmY
MRTREVEMYMKSSTENSIKKIDDHRLLERIRARIRWDIRVSNSDISLKVRDGRVTLFGYFDKPYRHAAAVNVITSAEGVKNFEDQSQVLGDYFRTDKELETLISKQVLGMAFSPGEWIDVSVCDGVARLEGRVSRSRHKAFAARATWELSGIKDCINMIEIGETPEVLLKSQTTYQAAEVTLNSLSARRFYHVT